MSKYNKAWVALIGVLVTWAAAYAPASYSHWLQLLVGLLTALGVYQVANSAPPSV